MRRVHLILCLTFVLTTVAGTCRAEGPNWWHSFWGRVKVDFHRNNAFPEPFRYHDRQIVRTAYDPYIARGWQIENTLSHFDFDAESGELTAGGQAKILWIATQAPPQRRTIFVLRGSTLDATEGRVDRVQQAVASMLPASAMPAVVRSDIGPGGLNAKGYYVNEMWTKNKAAVPSPVLSAASASSSGGGGN